MDKEQTMRERELAGHDGQHDAVEIPYDPLECDRVIAGARSILLACQRWGEALGPVAEEDYREMWADVIRTERVLESDATDTLDLSPAAVSMRRAARQSPSADLPRWRAE